LLPAYRQQPHDTLVYVEADDGSQSLEGVIVDGQRDEDGSFVLDAEFTVFTTDDNPGGETYPRQWSPLRCPIL